MPVGFWSTIPLKKLAELWSSLAEWSTTIFKLESNYIKWKNMICTKDKVSTYIYINTLITLHIHPTSLPTGFFLPNVKRWTRSGWRFFKDTSACKHLKEPGPLSQVSPPKTKCQSSWSSWWCGGYVFFFGSGAFGKLRESFLKIGFWVPVCVRFRSFCSLLFCCCCCCCCWVG